MSIKGYSTQKKLTQKLDGFTETQTADTNQFITAQKTSSEQVGLDVISNSLYRIHAIVKAAEAGSTNPKRILISTAHGAKPGDVIRFQTTSSNPGFQSGILSVPDADTIILAAELDADIVPTTDTFFILRHVTPLVDSDGAIPISTVGLATEAKQDDQITELASLRAGKSRANAPYRNDYSSVNVTTGAYVTAIASLTNTCSEIEIFDSSGQTLKLAIGAAASEIDQCLIFPGGNGRIPLAIPAGSRISLRAVSANAAVGEIDINFYA